MLIALFGGFAGILEQCRKEKGTVFSGVAIATALMPPLCTAGYRLASGNFTHFLGAMQILVDLTKEMAEDIMDCVAYPLARASCILICKGAGISRNRNTDSIFNESSIMAKLKVKEIGRNWWNRKSRRDIYVNGRHSGVLTGKEVEIEVEPGPCKVTVQNVFPSFRSTAYTDGQNL